VFATALAFSQVMTTPDAVKTQFDRARDREQVVQLLRGGCTHMRKAFDIEDINLDDLIATALDDPQAVASENKLFRGIDFADLQTAYRQFCTNEEVPIPAVDLAKVIDFYNKAAADLPDHTKLKGMKLPGASMLLDRAEFRAAEANLAQAIDRIETDSKAGDKRPPWQRALVNARLPLYDVHWMPAAVLGKPAGKRIESWRVGLPDGRIVPLALDNAA